MAYYIHPTTKSIISGINDTEVIVIMISAKSSGFHPHIKCLKDNSVIIGETYPARQQPFKQGSIYRAGVSLNELKFVPSLETYSAKSIPGCVIEAIISAQSGEIADQSVFKEKSHEIVFCAENIV